METPPKIISKIKITRASRKREASFKVIASDPLTGTPTELDLLITGKTLQDVIGKIEFQYSVKLTPEDYSYNYPLRKDEFVPETSISPAIVDEAEKLLIECTKTDEFKRKQEICFTCGKIAYGKVKPNDSPIEYFYCRKHFNELVITAPLRMEKMHRNAPCHCGSGKKYKFCCLPKEPALKGNYYDSLYERVQLTELETLAAPKCE